MLLQWLLWPLIICATISAWQNNYGISHEKLQYAAPLKIYPEREVPNVHEPVYGIIFKSNLVVTQSNNITYPYGPQFEWYYEKRASPAVVAATVVTTIDLISHVATAFKSGGSFLNSFTGFLGETHSFSESFKNAVTTFVSPNTFYRVICDSLTSTEPLQLATVESQVKQDVQSFTSKVTDLTEYRQEMYFTSENLKSVVEETNGKLPVDAVEHIYEFLLNNYKKMNNTHFVIMAKPDVNNNFQELFWECNEDSCVNFIDTVTKKAVFILKAPKADSYKRECQSLKDFAGEEHRKNWCQKHQEKNVLPLAVDVNACNMRSYVIMSYKAFLANSVYDAAFKIDTFTLSSSGILGTGEKCLGRVHVFSRFSKCDPSKENCQ